MSDLISRSELIDLILTENQRCITSTGHELTTNMIVSFIEKQPTAYDVNKVVAELEKVKTINVDVGYGTIYKTIRKDVAIEIVKQGGVSDDVCEWRLCDEEANVYDTSCRNPHILIEGTPKENNYEYCPYCGKKIKVVE